MDTHSLISIVTQRAQAVALSSGTLGTARKGDTCAMSGCRQPISLGLEVYRNGRQVAHRTCVDRLAGAPHRAGTVEVISLLEASKRMGVPYGPLRRDVLAHKRTDGVVKVRGKYKILASSCAPCVPERHELTADQRRTIEGIIEAAKTLLG